MFFRCELIGGSPATSFETTEVRFFGEHEIPVLSLPRVYPNRSGISMNTSVIRIGPLRLIEWITLSSSS